MQEVAFITTQAALIAATCEGSHADARDAATLVTPNRRFDDWAAQTWPDELFEAVDGWVQVGEMVGA